MGKKKPSLRAFKRKKEEERRRQRRQEAVKRAKSMTDLKVQQLAGESTNDSIHAQARKVFAARQEIKKKQDAARNNAVPNRKQKKKKEQGGSPPVIGEFAQPDWWRED
jgi:hypothetical protein